MKTLVLRIFVAFVAVILVAGCEKKKETNVIITSRPVKTVKKDTVKMEEIDNNMQVKWRGSTYNVQIKRNADTSLAITEDEEGKKYYDNKIALSILRSDGTCFIEKSFTKSDFESLVSDDTFSKKALVGLVFNKEENGCLKFAASVGSPDKFSDDFIPFEVTVSSEGGVSIKLSDLDLVEDSNEEDDI